MNFLWEDESASSQGDSSQISGFFNSLCQPFSETCEPRRATSHGGPSLVQMCLDPSSSQAGMVARPRGQGCLAPTRSSPPPRWSPSAAAGATASTVEPSTWQWARGHDIHHTQSPPIVDWSGGRPSWQTSGRGVDDGVHRVHKGSVLTLLHSLQHWSVLSQLMFARATLPTILNARAGVCSSKWRTRRTGSSRITERIVGCKRQLSAQNPGGMPIESSATGVWGKSAVPAPLKS